MQPQKFEAKSVISGYKSVRLMRLRVVLVPSRASRSAPGAGQKDQHSWDENGWESFENEHPAIMKHKCRDFLTQKFGLF